MPQLIKSVAIQYLLLFAVLGRGCGMQGWMKQILNSPATQSLKYQT